MSIEKRRKKMINKQEIKERVKKLIEAGVEIEFSDSPVVIGVFSNLGFTVPSKPKRLLLSDCDSDEVILQRIGRCEKELTEYMAYMESSKDSLANHLKSVLSPINDNRILGDSKSCTILPQHNNVIMIDCEELVSTESDCIWYKNEMIGKLSR